MPWYLYQLFMGYPRMSYTSSFGILLSILIQSMALLVFFTVMSFSLHHYSRFRIIRISYSVLSKYINISYTKAFMFSFICCSSKSLMQMLKRVELKTDPCSTPIFFIVIWLLKYISGIFSKFYIAFIVCLSIILSINFPISLHLFTQSNAFCRSINSKYSLSLSYIFVLLFLYCCSIIIYKCILFIRSSILLWHLCFSLNPLYLFEINYFRLILCLSFQYTQLIDFSYCWCRNGSDPLYLDTGHYLLIQLLVLFFS